MADIKAKNKDKGNIKTINKSSIASERMKGNIVRIRDKTQEENSNNENSITDYGSNKINSTIFNTTEKGIYEFNRYGKKSYEETINNIKTGKRKLDIYKKKKAREKIKKQTERTGKTIKTAGKSIKSAKNTAQKAIKTTENTLKTAQKTAKATTKASQKTAKMIKETAKAAARATRLAVKATIAAIKGIILATKALVAFLLAGGWVVVLIITVVCLIALLVSSVFGIFFASEDTGSTITAENIQQPVTMNKVIADLNKEFMDKITQIQKDNPYNEYDITSSRAEWKDILAVYSVKVNGGNNETDVITINDEKVKMLKDIFWEMNEITFTKDETTTEEVIIHLTWTERKTVTKVKLHITVKGKTVDEMADKYNFNAEQREQLAELTNEKYASMWNSVIYGSSIGSNDIVKVAESQIGNIGGQPYWSWYGFASRVEWCACFVSWCANECGYIDAGIIPKFAGCQAEGVEWFKTCGLWKDRGFAPKPGDIIFFDWADENIGVRNNSADHVGIVEKVENGKVYTIEGNSSDSCCRKDYDINSLDILGYGTPLYN